MNIIFLYMMEFMRYKVFGFVVYIFYLVIYNNIIYAEEINLTSEDNIIRIGFGSCNDQSLSQKFWQNIQSYKPDIFLQIGDNIYGSGDDLYNLAEAYKSLKNNIYYSNFSLNTKVIGIWDDHDYGVNDGGNNYKYKHESKELFLKFFNINKNDARNYRDGLYKEYILNYKDKSIQIILLDTRFFKSDFKLTDQRNAKGKERYIADYSKNKTILGYKQWIWLEEKLSQQFDIRIIVSSFQVLPLDHGWEKWGNFPLEQERLYSLVKNTSSYTFIISGDRHFGAIYKKQFNKSTSIYELTSSSLNKPLKFEIKEQDNMQLGETISEANFGLISIDWGKNKIYLELKSPNQKGSNSLLRHELFF